MTRRFAVTWDYRCPFARNAHEHLIVGLAAGADWQGEFWPFPPNQGPVAGGQPHLGDDPEKRAGLGARHAGPRESIATIDRLLDLTVGWPDLNEFKHTRIPR